MCLKKDFFTKIKSGKVIQPCQKGGGLGRIEGLRRLVEGTIVEGTIVEETIVEGTEKTRRNRKNRENRKTRT